MSRNALSRITDSRPTSTRSRAIALGTALLLCAGAAGAAVASDDGRTPHGAASQTSQASQTHAREAAALTGTAKLYRKTTEDVTFTFDAHLERHTMRPDKATGTFRFVDLDKPGGKGGWARAASTA